MDITPKILIVDDLEPNLSILKLILTTHLEGSVKVLTVNSAHKALDLVLKDEFSLIISDIQMPDISGYELANILLSNKKTQHIPIILMSAISKKGMDKLKGYQTGAIDYMEKPINAEVLLTKVNILLRFYKIQKELESALHLNHLFLKQLNTELKNNLNCIVDTSNELLASEKLAQQEIQKIQAIHKKGKFAQQILNNALINEVIIN